MTCEIWHEPNYGFVAKLENKLVIKLDANNWVDAENEARARGFDVSWGDGL